MLKLREYQQEAVNNTIAQLKKSAEPCLINASVSSGKTFINAGIMQWIEQSGRNSLCLSMNSELIEQNSDCYHEFCNKNSVFCSKLGHKNYRLRSVFATPQTLWAAIKKGHPISEKNFSLICIDECHNVSANNEKTTYMQIINHYKRINPNMRIVGLTGTPFRGKGVPILGPDAFFRHETATIDMKWLVEHKFVVPIIYGKHKSDDYDYSDLKLQSNGKFKASELAEVSEGKGRLTSEIIQEVIKNSQDEGGVIIFASTIAHCKEVLESLPDGISCMITGETPDKERQKLVKQIKSGEIKYTVNLNVLTVGFSAPYVSHVVFLRPTESAVLWIQAVGRAVRQLEGKDHALVSDYAGNLDRLGDVDDPIITDMIKSRDKDIDLDVPCPECGELNSVFARRCTGSIDGIRCGFFFDFKQCPTCECQNDTTARNCRDCGTELIDPNKKLNKSASLRIGIEPITVPVMSAEYTRHKKRGKVDSLRCDYMIELPNGKAEIISEWFSPDSDGYPKHIFKRDFAAKHAPHMVDHSLDDVISNKLEINSPPSLMINKMVGNRYLNIVMKVF